MGYGGKHQILGGLSAPRKDFQKEGCSMRVIPKCPWCGYKPAEEEARLCEGGTCPVCGTGLPEGAADQHTTYGPGRPRLVGNGRLR